MTEESERERERRQKSFCKNVTAEGDRRQEEFPKAAQEGPLIMILNKI